MSEQRTRESAGGVLARSGVADHRNLPQRFTVMIELVRDCQSDTIFSLCGREICEHSNVHPYDRSVRIVLGAQFARPPIAQIGEFDANSICDRKVASTIGHSNTPSVTSCARKADPSNSRSGVCLRNAMAAAVPAA